MDFRQERERLVDSKRFCETCMALRLAHNDVADHVVFEGKGVVEKVLKEGLQIVGEKVHMFNDPLWKDTEGRILKIDRGRKRCCVEFVFDDIPRTVWLGYDLVRVKED